VATRCVIDFFTLWFIIIVVNVVQGSTVARQASEKERAKDLPTYKDNDFLNERREISVGPEKRALLMQTIQADTEVGRNELCMFIILRNTKQYLKASRLHRLCQNVLQHDNAACLHHSTWLFQFSTLLFLHLGPF